MSIRVFLLCLLLATPAYADKLAWDYDLTKGAVPATVVIERGPSATGPFTPVATIAALPSTYLLGPADSLWYRVRSSGGASNVIQFTPLTVTSTYDDTALKAAIAALSARITILEAATTTPDDDTALTARTGALETKLAGVCRAAKAMGGSASSFAGRIRKEIPCP